MESMIGLFKTELIKPRRPWKTLSDIELATAEWIDWYNHRRLHGEKGHIPPVEYEAKHYEVIMKPRSQPQSEVSTKPGTVHDTCLVMSRTGMGAEMKGPMRRSCRCSRS
ncbi:hypothetical protein GCM10010425_59850 [Streptomyces spororaveus]|uniref:Integrase catalytic domain-containing protein n=1 Tax=Streptomyces spororaveus TaxID=284039 RepID=A0ABQ3T6X9_9ACTN|nr:hypothetical protein Sspor_17050 [Streptomyces spororaveus]